MKEKEEIHLVFDGFGISGNIFIANYSAASSFSLLCQNKIGAIVTAGRGLFLNHSKQHIPSYLYLPIDDSPQQELSQFFDVSFQFIDKNIERTNVLVHCYSGVSRSAAIIAAYLIKKYSFSLKESIILLRNNKKRIKPNPSFLRQLLQLQKRIGSDSSAGPLCLPQDREKQQKLHFSIATLKSEGQSIALRINSARAKLEESHEKRRPSSDIIRKALEKRSQRNSIDTNDAYIINSEKNQRDLLLGNKQKINQEGIFNARKTFG